MYIWCEQCENKCCNCKEKQPYATEQNGAVCMGSVLGQLMDINYKNVTLRKIWYLVLLGSGVTTPNTVQLFFLWGYVNVSAFAPPPPTNNPRWYTLVTRDVLATIPEGHEISNCSLPSNSEGLGYVPAVFTGTLHRFSVDMCMSHQQTINITLISTNLSCIYSFLNIPVQWYRKLIKTQVFMDIMSCETFSIFPVWKHPRIT